MMSRIAAVQGLILVTAMSATVPGEAKSPIKRLTPAEAVRDHCAAWNTTDRARRDRLLKHVFAADGVYADPTPTYVAGRVALSNEIGSFQRQYPGARFRCSPPQAHHGAMRVSWLLIGPDSKVVTEGTDFYELAPDGLIRRVTGFFGPPPRVPASA